MSPPTGNNILHVLLTTLIYTTANVYSSRAADAGENTDNTSNCSI